MRDHEEENSGSKSKLFSDPHADLIFCSSDNVLFDIHSRYLKGAHLGLLGGNDKLTIGSEDGAKPLIILDEHSSTLELMFQFMYPWSELELEDLAFDDLVKLSEAAEKYHVYPALPIYNIFLTGVLPEHALEVLNYSVKYHYHLLSDKAAPFVTLEDVSRLSESISPNVVRGWLRYYQEWDATIRQAVESYQEANSSWSRTPCCNELRLKHERDIYRALNKAKGPCETDSIVSLINVPSDAKSCCRNEASRWRELFEKTFVNIRPFTDFL